MIREESVEEGVPKTPPTTPVANYPKPLPLRPAVSIEIDPPKSTVQKMFSVDMVDEDLFQKDLETAYLFPRKIKAVSKNVGLFQDFGFQVGHSN